MIIAPIPENEHERLKALYKLELLDTEYEEDFDHIVQLASRICNTPYSVISLIDFDRQWYKAQVGMGSREADRQTAFCTHTILQDDFFEVQDALTDERFHDNPFVINSPNIRYYGGVPLITNDGYKLGTLCVFDDRPRVLNEEQTVTMRTLAGQVMKLVNMRVMNKHLESVNNMQKRTISILAHDIRNPLASISSIYELKNDGILSDDDQKEMEEMIPGQIQSTLDLLNNVVQWGNIQLQKTDLDQHFTTPLQSVIDHCFAVLALQAKEKGNELINKVPPETVIDCNEASLEFIFRNLLTNACKFTQNGSITVSAEPGRRWVNVKVSDTGVGMTQDQLDAVRARKPFGVTVGTKNEKGNGLGLSLIHETLSVLKGKLQIDSEKGKGSVFTLTFPAG